jgi:Leucine-rich repeat (LRR) protein
MIRNSGLYRAGMIAVALCSALTAGADRIDVDYDFMLWAIDETLDEMAPGQFAHIYGADRDGNGLREEDHLGLLSAVLLNNSPALSEGMVATIQSGFRFNMTQVARDLVFDINVLGQSVHMDVLAELNREDPLFALSVQYFLAGYMTCGDQSTFNFINNMLRALVRYFAEREGYGWALDYININDYINFNASRYVTFGNTGTNYLGANGNVDADGQTNIQEYSGSGTREVWFVRCQIVPPPRIAVNPANGSCQTGDQFPLSATVAGGDGTLTYQWLRTDSNGREFPSSYDFIGPNAPAYTIPYATVLDRARFSVAVSDVASIFNPGTRMGGRQSWGARINVLQVPLQILVQPVGNNLNVGDNYTLQFRVKGGVTTPTYQWTRNGVLAGPNSSSWAISPITGSSQGVYQCRAISGGEQVTSVAVTINVFGAGSVVHFDDPNLEAAIRAELGFDETKDIYEGDLVGITSLDAESRGIVNLSGIEKLFNLTDLNLWNNQISDLTFLGNLFSLQTLNLALNQIADTSALANLEQLQRLFLWDNQLVDILPLLGNAGLGAGDEIGLEGNPLSEETLCLDIPELQARGVLVGFDGVCPLAEGEGILEGEGDGLLEGEGSVEGAEGEGQSEGQPEGEGEGQVFGECDIEVHSRGFASMLDPGNTVLPLNVPVSKTIENLRVTLNVTHSAVEQLSVLLTSPQGTDVFLFMQLPNGGANLTDTVFTDGATPIAAGTPPYTGEFAPMTPLASLIGQDMEGVWVLKLVDNAAGAAGRVERWSLLFNECPAEGEGQVDGEGTAEGITEGATEGEGEGIPEGASEGQLPNEIHCADTNADNTISLTELLRVIQFFNIREFACGAGTEDGYAPGAGPRNCMHHSSDYAPTDWQISLTELLRLIQFFNTGGYHVDATSEDGYAPGLT